MLDILPSEECILELICEGQKLSKERVGFFFSPERESRWLLLKLMPNKESLPLAVGWILIVFRISYWLQTLKHTWEVFKKDIREARKIRPSNLHFDKPILFSGEERHVPCSQNGSSETTFLHVQELLSRGKRQDCWRRSMCMRLLLSFCFFFFKQANKVRSQSSPHPPSIHPFICPSIYSSTYPSFQQLHNVFSKLGIWEEGERNNQEENMVRTKLEF